MVECERLYGPTMRRTWMFFLHNENSICKQYKNNSNAVSTDQVDYEGCGSCSECRFCYVKLTIVMQACQGTSDDNVLTLFDHIFNENPIFKNYTMQDWLSIDRDVLTCLYWRCSCQYKNTVSTVTVLDALKVYFESNNAVPNSDWWITETKNEIYYHFRNFGKKTSLLVMIGTQGYNKGYGIVTDSHVAAIPIWK